MHVFDFACLAWKCLFALLELGFKVFDSINGELYQRNPQKAHPCAERCRMTPRLLDWSTSATCACDEETTKERNLIVAKRYESNHPCPWIEIKFCMVRRLLSKTVKQFPRCWESKFALSHYIGHLLIQQSVLAYRP